MQRNEEQIIRSDSLEARRRASTSLMRIRDAAVELVTPRYWLSRHPIVSVAAALGAGAYAGLLIRRLMPRRAQRESAPECNNASSMPPDSVSPVGQAMTNVLVSALLTKILAINDLTKPPGASPSDATNS